MQDVIQKISMNENQQCTIPAGRNTPGVGQLNNPGTKKVRLSPDSRTRLRIYIKLLITLNHD